MEVILNWLNLQEAIEAVKRNKGAAGVDGKSITETEQHIGEHWPKIEAKLMAGSYVPSDIKGVKIPKPQVVFKNLCHFHKMKK